MKILIDSYSTVTQNFCGGVNVKIRQLYQNLLPYADIKLYDKWNDKIEDYDILHVVKADMDTFSVIKLAKKKGLKIVVSAILNPKNDLKMKVNKFLGNVLKQYNSYKIQKTIFDMAEVILCETENEKELVSKAYAIEKEKMFVIPNGICDVREDASEQYFRDKTGIEGKFILQVGRFDPNKNQLSTIKAVNGTDMQLVLIGGADKECEEYFEKCKAEATENVHFLGWVDHDDVLLHSAYKAAHVTILPSHKEIFGSALLEGGLYGCNIVATEVLPIETWGLKDECHTINPDKIEDIREKLSLACNKEKNQIASELIREQFSWENVTKQHLDVYTGVINMLEKK